MDLDELLMNALISDSTTEARPGEFRVAVPTGDDVLVGTFSPEDLPPEIFVGRDAGAMATAVSWAPTGDVPTKPVWAIAAVVPGRPARFGIGPYDGSWYRIMPSDLPWFLASTAGAIRSSLEGGEALVLKTINDESLYGRVRDGQVPPLDENDRV